MKTNQGEEEVTTTRMDWVRDIKLRMQAVKLTLEEADQIIAFIQHRVRA